MYSFREARAFAAVGAAGAALAVSGLTLLLVSLSSTAWSRSAENATPAYRSGLWKACGIAGGNLEACTTLNEDVIGGGLLSVHQLHQLRAVRALTLVAAAMLAMATLVYALIAVRHRPTMLTISLPVTMGVLGSACLVSSLILYGDLSKDAVGFFGPASRFGYSFYRSPLSRRCRRRSRSRRLCASST